MHVALAVLTLAGCERVLISFGSGPTGDSGTPGDADGDDVTVSVDCDDANPDVGASAPESWNGRDDDCDGRVDDLDVGAVAIGTIGGPTADAHLGDAGTLSLGGDLTGDTIPDVVLGSWATGTGSVWVRDGASVIGSDDSLSELYAFRAYGYTSSEPLGFVDGPMEDITGDGVADLFVVAVNLENDRSPGAAFLIAGGELSGTHPVGEAAVALFTGSEGDRLRHAQLADVDGDGVADVILSAPYDGYYGSARGISSGDAETGNVSVYSGAEVEPYYWYYLEFATDQIHGDVTRDHLGTSLSHADLDDDGYVDIVAGAPDARLRGEDQKGSGVVYLFPGNANASWAGHRAADAARATVFADDDVVLLGAADLARPGDLDGDGAPDLAIADPSRAIHVWYGAGSLKGAVPWSAANWILPVNDGCGTTVTADADLDADGRDELVLGCPNAATPGPDAGAIRIFSGELPFADLSGEAANDHLGAAMSTGADLHRGGGEELVVGAPGNDRDGTEAGRVYVLGLPDDEE